MDEPMAVDCAGHVPGERIRAYLEAGRLIVAVRDGDGEAWSTCTLGAVTGESVACGILRLADWLADMEEIPDA